jgi:hypothetical protein
MATRTVRFRPLVIDGVGDPAVARGSYRVTPFKQGAFGDLWQLLTDPGLIISISGVAVNKDLPVVEVGDHNCLVVEGFFGPNAKMPNRPSSVEYVFVPAGGTVIDYEDLPRVLPDTLTPVPIPPSSEWELRLQDVEAALAAGGGSGGGAPPGGGPGGAIRPEDLFGITATGIALDKATDAAAARTAIGAGTSSLTIGTSNTTAAQGDRAALKDATQTINAIWTFATNPVFNNDAIPQARVVGLAAFVTSVNAFIAGGPAPLDSPAFTGTPTAPTAVTVTSNTQLATTAFAHAVADVVQANLDAFEATRGATNGIAAIDSLGNVTNALGAQLTTFADVDGRISDYVEANPTPVDIQNQLDQKATKAELADTPHVRLYGAGPWPSTRPWTDSRPAWWVGGPEAPAPGVFSNALGDIWWGTPA